MRDVVLPGGDAKRRRRESHGKIDVLLRDSRPAQESAGALRRHAESEVALGELGDCRGTKLDVELHLPYAPPPERPGRRRFRHALAEEDGALSLSGFDPQGRHAPRCTRAHGSGRAALAYAGTIGPDLQNGRRAGPEEDVQGEAEHAGDEDVA